MRTFRVTVETTRATIEAVILADDDVAFGQKLAELYLEPGERIQTCERVEVHVPIVLQVARHEKRVGVALPPGVSAAATRSEQYRALMAEEKRLLRLKAAARRRRDVEAVQRWEARVLENARAMRELRGGKR